MNLNKNFNPGNNIENKIIDGIKKMISNPDVNVSPPSNLHDVPVMNSDEKTIKDEKLISS